MSDHSGHCVVVMGLSFDCHEKLYPYILEQSLVQDRSSVLFIYHNYFPPEIKRSCINYTLVLTLLWITVAKVWKNSETSFFKNVLCTLLAYSSPLSPFELFTVGSIQRVLHKVLVSWVVFTKGICSWFCPCMSQHRLSSCVPKG